MAQVSLDMYQTLAIAVVALLIGAWLKTKIKVLDRLCIPSPVVGGLLFSIITCVLYATSIVDFKWDDTLKNVCMVIFFTSVGFQANVKVLKSGRKSPDRSFVLRALPYRSAGRDRCCGLECDRR